MCGTRLEPRDPPSGGDFSKQGQADLCDLAIVITWERAGPGLLLQRSVQLVNGGGFQLGESATSDGLVQPLDWHFYGCVQLCPSLFELVEEPVFRTQVFFEERVPHGLGDELANVVSTAKHQQGLPKPLSQSSGSASMTSRVRSGGVKY